MPYQKKSKQSSFFFLVSRRMCNAWEMDGGHQPDAFEKRLRFGCGFVFGGIVLLFLGMREITVLTAGFWAFVVGGALIFGFLAMRCGDDFWWEVSKWF